MEAPAGFAYTGRRSALLRFLKNQVSIGDFDVAKEVIRELVDQEIEDEIFVNKEEFINEFQKKLKDSVTLLLTPEEPEKEKESAEEELLQQDDVVVEFGSELVHEVLKAVANALHKEREYDFHIREPLSPDSIAKVIVDLLHQIQSLSDIIIDELDEPARSYVRKAFKDARIATK